jgi:hypothetical protein
VGLVTNRHFGGTQYILPDFNIKAQPREQLSFAVFGQPRQVDASYMSAAPFAETSANPTELVPLAGYIQIAGRGRQVTPKDGEV